jgi:hypothetical protein
MALTKVSSGLISSVANTAITGNIISSQITSVANTQVTGLITASQIATVANTQVTGLITSGQIASVANTQVTGLITSGQIASVANTQITGILGTSNGGTGQTSLASVSVGSATSATTATTATNLASGSNGTIPYQSASGTTQMLAVGTSGQVLQTNGAGAPSWVTPSAGAMTLINTQTASNSSSIEFTGLSGYDKYFLIIDDISTNGSYSYIVLGTGAGPTYLTSGYGYIYFSNTGTTSGLTTNAGYYNASASQWTIANPNFGGNNPINTTVNMAGFTSGVGQSIQSVSSMIGVGAFDRTAFSGYISNSSNVTAIKISPNIGVFASGTISLYGISS